MLPSSNVQIVFREETVSGLCAWPVPEAEMEQRTHRSQRPV